MKPIVTLLLILSLTWSGTSAQANGLAKYEWEPVERAAYFLLVVTLHDKSFYIRTNGTHVLLEEGALVRMLVFDPRARVIGWPTPLVTTMVSPSSPASSAVVMSASLLPEASAPAHANPNTVTPAPVPTPEATSAEEPPPSVEEDTRSPELAAEMERLADLAEEEKEAFAGSPHRYISASLGMGSDEIKANGGASRFAGSTKVALVDLQFWWSRLSESASFGALHGLRAHLHLHNFVTSKTVKVENSTDDYEETMSLGRANAGVSLEHLFLRGAHMSWYGGYGLGFFEAPRMVIVNADNAASELSPHSGTGLLLSSGVQMAPLGALHMLHAGAQYWPWLINNKGATRWLFEIESLYLFLPTLYGSLALRSSGESLAGQVNCPASVTSCRSSTATTTNLLGLSLGLGLIF